jgi:putative transposase
MGLEAIYPKPKLSKKGAHAQQYPYLLKGIVIEPPNQVWSTDITYCGHCQLRACTQALSTQASIRLPQGFVYLMAIMDWFGRYVLAWEVSNSLDPFFCMAALERALQIGHPEIFNSDQGSPFTCEAFTQCLKRESIRISWDGRGSVRLRRFVPKPPSTWDNIFVERLWRSVKYEEGYLKDYADVPEAIQGLSAYFSFYNTERPHQSLGYNTPAQLFFR